MVTLKMLRTSKGKSALPKKKKFTAVALNRSNFRPHIKTCATISESSFNIGTIATFSLDSFARHILIYDVKNIFYQFF